MTLDDIIKDLEDDLERMKALRTGGTKAYFEEVNRQNRRKNIRGIINKLENDWGPNKCGCGICSGAGDLPKPTENQDRDFGLKEKYGEN